MDTRDIEIRDRLADYLGIKLSGVYTLEEREKMCEPAQQYYDNNAKKTFTALNAVSFPNAEIYNPCAVRRENEKFLIFFEKLEKQRNDVALKNAWVGPGEARVVGIAVLKSDKIKTSRNLGVGSSFGDVKNAYGGGIIGKARYKIRTVNGYTVDYYACLLESPIAIQIEHNKEDGNAVSLKESQRVVSIIFLEDNIKYW